MPGGTRWSQIVKSELRLVTERVSTARNVGSGDGESGRGDVVARVRDSVVEEIRPIQSDLCDRTGDGDTTIICVTARSNRRVRTISGLNESWRRLDRHRCGRPGIYD